MDTITITLLLLLTVCGGTLAYMWLTDRREEREYPLHDCARDVLHDESGDIECAICRRDLTS